MSKGKLFSPTLCGMCHRMLKALEQGPRTLSRLADQLKLNPEKAKHILESSVTAGLIEPVRKDAIPRRFCLTRLGRQWAEKPLRVKPLERLRKLEARVTELEKKAADRQNRINERALPLYEKTDPYED